MLTNNVMAIAQDVRHFLLSSTHTKEFCRQRLPKAVRVGICNADF